MKIRNLKTKKKKLLAQANPQPLPESSSWRISLFPFMVSFLCLLFVISSSIAEAVESDDIVGVWLIERDDEAAEKIGIYPCDGGYCGKIIWLKSSADQPEPPLDINNKDESLRCRPLLDLEIITDYQFDGEDSWHDGNFYSHRRGKSASPEFSLLDANHLQVKVTILLFKKTFVWPRVAQVSP